MSQLESKAHAAADFLNFVPAMFAMQKEFLHTVESDRRPFDSRCDFSLPGMRRASVRDVRRRRPPVVD